MKINIRDSLCMENRNTSINRRKSVEYRNNSLEYSSPAHKKRQIT